MPRSLPAWTYTWNSFHLWAPALVVAGSDTDLAYLAMQKHTMQLLRGQQNEHRQQRMNHDIALGRFRTPRTVSPHERQKLEEIEGKVKA